MDKKKTSVWLPLLLGLSMAVGMFIGFKMRDNFPEKSFFYKGQHNTVEEVVSLIKNRYVDSIELSKIQDTAIEAMLSKLDPHSVFIPADELERVNEEIQGSFYGIGIEFNLFDDTLNVVNLIKDGPGDKAGLRIGDKIITADGKNIAGRKITFDSVRNIIRGSRGSLLKIRLLRNNQPLSIEVKRDIIPLTSIDASYMLDSKTGYIRLNKFSTQTYREFMVSLDSLKKLGMTKLVIDLRGNGGGVLDEAVEIADELIDGNKLITYTEGLHIPKKEYRCKRTGQFEQGKLVLLCDENSASASEVLMGALQDWDRATIIGRRSFGKGLVQEQFDLSDHSAVRLTVARYYTPLGRSIQRSYANGEKDYYEEIEKRITNGEDSTKKNQSNAAAGKFKTASGKKLSDKGGITPDYVIPSDTTLFEESLQDFFDKGIVQRYAYLYGLKNPQLKQTYGTPEKFAELFLPAAEDWVNLKKMADAEGVGIESAGQKEQDKIMKLLKAYIGRQLWRNSAYHIVINREDEDIKKAMEVLK